MRRDASHLVGVVALGVAVALAAPAPAAEVSRAPVVAFQAAGDIGGGPLTPGTFFPPDKRGFATLKRGSDWVGVNIQTSGLPHGAYTVWWVVFNNPAGCVGGCGEDDLLRDEAEVTVFYATGGVVGKSGTGSFHARHDAGDDLGEPGSQHLLGTGALDPGVAEVHNVIKWHGRASKDRDVLYEQTHTVLGSCLDGANAVELPPPFGINCFDPQAVAHPLP